MTKTVRIISTIAAALALGACASDEPDGPATVEIRGSDPAAATTAAAAPVQDGSLGAPPVGNAPTASGIVTYEGYQAAVARNGDTVASVADRIGLSGSELGAYNGLAPTHPLRAGDELVLPPKPGGYDTGLTGGQQVAAVDTGSQTVPVTDTTGAWSPDLAAAAIDRSAQPTGLDESGNLAFPPSNAEPLPPSPQAPGELRSPQLRQYQTPSDGQLGQIAMADPSDQATAGQPAASQAAGELAAAAPLAPVTADQPEAAAEQPAEGQLPLDVTPADGNAATEPAVTPVPRPVETITTPSEQVVEPEPQPAPQPEPQPQAQPEAEQQVASAPAAGGPLRLIPPVSGPIVKRFGQGGGRGSSDGIDFASPAGAPVVAAAGGEVALVSQSLGGLGTIVLVRHPDDYLTVYGRIEKVTVGKGDLVSSGQQIGVVSPSPKPRMHFELRRGAEGLDPELYF